MSNYQIERFNYVVGNPPKGIDSSKEEIWEQLKLQAKLLLEEAQETFDAAEARDIVEFLDGVVDVWFLREYIDTLLFELGVDVKKAKSLVCDNNNSKFTTSLKIAQDTKEFHSNVNNIPCEIREVQYEGGTYYVVVRDEDGKVLKPTVFNKVNLTECVPNSIMTHLDNKE